MDGGPTLLGVILLLGTEWRAFFLGVTLIIFSLGPLVVSTLLQATRVTGVEGWTGIIFDLTISDFAMQVLQS